MEYDANFSALVRIKSNYPLDGIPLVIGIAGLLRQFHPQVTRSLLAYIGQFIRTTTFDSIGSATSNIEKDNGKAAANAEFPLEVINLIIFVDQLCQYANIARSIIHEFIPALTFDTIKVSVIKK